jgi:hypothetical protein
MSKTSPQAYGELVTLLGNMEKGVHDSAQCLDNRRFVDAAFKLGEIAERARTVTVIAKMMIEEIDRQSLEKANV